MERLKTLSFFIIMLLTGSAIGIDNQLEKLKIIFVNPLVDTSIIIVVAAGLYPFLLNIITFIISSSDFLMKWYWGKKYLNGLWTYTSHDEDGKEYLGIWRIDQNLFGSTVVAFGLDSQFRRRTRVKSVSDIIGKNGVYEILNERLDWEYTKVSSYSKTTLIPDSPSKRFLFRYPIIMRGETEIFGGPRDGVVTRNVIFRKHEDILTEEELIKKVSNTQLQE